MLGNCRSIAKSLIPKRAVPIRAFHNGGKKSSRDTAPVIDTDSKQVTKLYHLSQLALAGLCPVAFALSPSVLNTPVDFALGFIIPFHAYVAVNYVITDYVPKFARAAARLGVFGAVVIAAAGILKLNVTGPGLTDTVKNLWRAPKKD